MPWSIVEQQKSLLRQIVLIAKLNTLWQKCLEYHSEKICYLTHAFLFEVQMNGKRDFGMPFITLGVSD